MQLALEEHAPDLGSGLSHIHVFVQLVTPTQNSTPIIPRNRARGCEAAQQRHDSFDRVYAMIDCSIVGFQASVSAHCLVCMAYHAFRLSQRPNCPSLNLC